MTTNRTTFTRALTFTAAALVALLAAAPSANIDQRDRLTFRRPVALPGVVLPTGTYLFEVANPDSSRVVVRVTNRDTRRVYYAGFTMTIPRPSNLPAGQVVTFGEAPAGEAVPITAWYPTNRLTGHRFIW